MNKSNLKISLIYAILTTVMWEVVMSIIAWKEYKLYLVSFTAPIMILVLTYITYRRLNKKNPKQSYLEAISVTYLQG